MRVPPARRFRIPAVVTALALLGSLHGTGALAQGTAAASQLKTRNSPAPGILDRTQASAIMPATVFFRGQSATTQGRNSAGVRFEKDRLMLAAVVDTGGYATAIAQLYQAYLITEVKLAVGEKVLVPGAYGFGFLEDDQMVVMDVGGNELFRATTHRDPSLRRPTPLQIVAAPASPQAFRLYLGRSYVDFAAAP